MTAIIVEVGAREPRFPNRTGRFGSKAKTDSSVAGKRLTAVNFRQLTMDKSSKATDKHMHAQKAKEFLIAQIVEEAQRENVPLLEVERKMLYFSEQHETMPDMYEVNDQFESEYDTPTYEKKVAGLLRNARKRFLKESPGGGKSMEAGGRGCTQRGPLPCSDA